MTAELVIRVCALYVPMLALVGAAVIRRATRRDRDAAVLACIWSVVSLVIVHQLAAKVGWWTIEVHGGARLLGLPVELLVGWTLLWGAVPILAVPRVPLPVIVGAALAFDLLVMPRCAPVVRLGSSWPVGEAIALAVCLLPAQLLARWTREDRRLPARATLQVVCFAAIILWLVPSAVFERTGADEHAGWDVLGRYNARDLQVILQLVAIAALPGLSAVQELVSRGGGTPVPLDPPRRLVTSGVYRFVANPMQVSAALTAIAWGILLRSWWVAGGSVVMLLYGVGFAAWVEDRELAERFGDGWRRYRRDVHAWWPRWRPYVAQGRPIAGEEPADALLYVAFTCGKCSEVGRWLLHRRPRGLRIVPAEQHPTRDLWRMTYAPAGPGPEEAGIAALARALEHIHLGWALAGMFVRLPLIRPCVQAIVDVSGGGPQRIARTCEPPLHHG